MKPRGKPIARRSPPKKRNPARQKKNKARANGSAEYLAWFHMLPCATCGWAGNTQLCHAKNGGLSRKADWTLTFPGCGPHCEYGELVGGCHAWLHRDGVKSFEAYWSVNLLDLAAKTQADFAAYQQAKQEEP